MTALKITYCVAMSSDGYIAGENGDVSWLDGLEPDESDKHLEELFADIDGIVMGRATYDFIHSYGAWPYENKPSWLISSRPAEVLPGARLERVESIDEFLLRAGESSLKHVWLLGGGQLASGFMDRNLVTNLILTRFPVTLEKGIPLFSDHSLDTIKKSSCDQFQQKGYERIEIVL